MVKINEVKKYSVLNQGKSMHKHICLTAIAIATLACVSAFAAAENFPAQNSMILMLRFDSKSTVNSVAQPAATVYGYNLGYSAGRMINNDWAANFNGSSSYISVPMYPTMANRTFTISLWFKRATPTSTGYLAQRPNIDPIGVARDGWTMRIGSGDTIHCLFSNVTNTVDLKKKILQDTLWHNVVLSSIYGGNLSVVWAWFDGEMLPLSGNGWPVASGVLPNTFDGIIIGAADLPSATASLSPLPGTYFTGSIDNVVLYSKQLIQAEVDTLYGQGWMPDPDNNAQGQFKVPLIVHKVLYDPPGDGSYSSFKEDTTYRTEVSTVWRTGNGATSEIGWGYAYDFFGFQYNQDKVQTNTVTSSVQTTSRATWTTTSSQTFETSKTTDPSTNGPYNGDIIVCQSATFGWQLLRQLKKNAALPVVDSSFNYRVVYWPIADQAGDELTMLTPAQIKAKYSRPEYKYVGDTILSQLAYDPSTRRIRQSLINSGDLEKQPRLSWTTGSWSGDLTTTSSKLYHYSWDVNFTSDVRTSKKISGIGGQAGSVDKTTVTMGFGGDNANSVTFSSTCGYHLSDDDGWDRFTMDRYLDKRSGTFVFDVIKDSSYASFPFEDSYAKRAVDWTIAEVNPPSPVAAGDGQIHTIRVTNTTPSITGVPDSFKVQAEVTNYTYAGGATINPTQKWIRRGQSCDFTVVLSAPSADTTTATVSFDLLRPESMTDIAGESQDVNLTGIFTTPVLGVFIRAPELIYYVPTSTTGSVTHNFTAFVKNVSAQSEKVVTGFSNFSSGTVPSISSFPASVASGDSVPVSIGLNCNPLTLPHTADFYAQIDTFTSTRKTLTFRIDTAGTIKITNPVTTTVLVPNTPLTLRWTRSGISLNAVAIHYSTDGTTWKPVVDSFQTRIETKNGALRPIISYISEYTWTVPSSLEGDTISIRVADQARPGVRFDVVKNLPVKAIVVPPPIPVLDYPVDKMAKAPDSLKFTWRRATRAVSYRLQLATDSLFTVPAADSAGIPDTTFIRKGLLHETQYFWRVNAYNTGGWSGWSTARSFTTLIAYPDPVALVTPLDNDTIRTDSVAALWNSGSPMVIRYCIRYSQDSAMANAVVVDSAVTNTFKMLRGLSDLAIYYWQVRAYNEAGWGEWSKMQRFKVNTKTATRPFILPKKFSCSIIAKNGILHYALPDAAVVTIRIYSLRGTLIASPVNRQQAAGYYEATLFPSSMGAGTYLVLFNAGKYQFKTKTFLMR
jgi:hypothetical protein